MLVQIEEDESPPMPENQRFTQQIRQEALEYEVDRLHQREREVNQLEQDVVDINNMMREMADLVTGNYSKK